MDVGGHSASDPIDPWVTPNVGLWLEGEPYPATYADLDAGWDACIADPSCGTAAMVVISLQIGLVTGMVAGPSALRLSTAVMPTAQKVIHTRFVYDISINLAGGYRAGKKFSPGEPIIFTPASHILFGIGWGVGATERAIRMSGFFY